MQVLNTKGVEEVKLTKAEVRAVAKTLSICRMIERLGLQPDDWGKTVTVLERIVANATNNQTT